ncbi:hypothetical protein AYM17_06205 [Coxiella burnetii]|uniref:Uncharacterized protein n=1 Tax=Coxiella burnetii (strain Dugway 5J108-111) TaxID=434922 RepID=A9KDS2_COXBN|nr:hypothetical protein CBUD_0747 [Coxiella burnetii Dugway 5J108-111]ACJ18591.1 hypothetical protein CbuG_1269 [Coxiella burnetii CbuG_Q212]ACJ20683.1 hypothetical protein CbuK_1521 [Coxiella burnetii CbuK_Q154]ATN66972.1 hypothetical protein AYM17_06205 [Coxiella burnetii]ATN85314.1 hypothetical protein AYO29_01760 [Coxiella burnetii str. Schperling]EAX32048.1 hypothetical protein A35_07750 [Coxiella burnetii 'MSU Goat Q177']EDR35140.1 hypothetical protein COXBURSA334_0720 [Coxiella burneti
MFPFYAYRRPLEKRNTIVITIAMEKLTFLLLSHRSAKRRAGRSPGAPSARCARRALGPRLRGDDEGAGMSGLSF